VRRAFRKPCLGEPTHVCVVRYDINLDSDSYANDRMQGRRRLHPLWWRMR